jgi:predicted nuclease of predicted toxin-antitoxin system
MSLSILVDMNLSPEWVPLIAADGWQAVHLGPSVLQLRGQATLPDQVGTVVLAAFKQYEQELDKGALVVDVSRSRVRVLPL